MEGTYFRSRIEENMRRATQVWFAEGRAEGIAEGRAEAIREGLKQQRTLLVRQVATKFGARAAARIGPPLVRIVDPALLAEIGEWLIECDHGEELLKRVAGLRATSAAGDVSSRG